MTTKLRVGLALAAAVLCAASIADAVRPASAQGWWPWANESIPSRPAPIQREPAPGWRPPPGTAPQPQPRSGYVQPGQRSSVCLQLEQRLVDDQRGGSQPRDALPRIENDLRTLDRTVRTAEQQLERSDCYDYFLFSKSLRRTKRCVDMQGQLDTSKRQLAELDAQRRQILGTGSRSLQDDLIRELARNGCGTQYNQEAQRRGGGNNPFSSLWQDEDTHPDGRGNDFRSLPFATYRTVCVRLCDGYFFPISFSTLENHFGRDSEACQAKCAAPVELYYHQNPGGTMEQAVSINERRPYTSLKSAFRYRKEFVQGCSCKQAEYTPSPADQGERKADVPARGTAKQAAQRP